jgi:hypothetical protein
MADRYWVGGTAAWDGTAGSKWATTSGGAGGASVPSFLFDDVFFDAASGAVTCTISANNGGAKSINCTGFTGTLAGSANITVAGSFTLVAGMGFTHTGQISISGPATVTSAGKTLGSLAASGTGATITLGGALTASGGFTLSSGTLNLNGFTLSAAIIVSSNTLSRAITFGTANIVLTTASPTATIISMEDATNFTYTGTGGFVRNMVASGTVVFGTTGGSVTNAPNLTVNAGASALTITANSWFKNLNFTGSTSTVTSTNVNIAGNLTLASGGTYTAVAPTYRATGTLTSNGKTLSALTVNGSGITVTLSGALTAGTTTLTQGTLNLNGFTLSTGIFSSANSNTRGITFGSANIALTSTTAATTVLGMATATNFTYTGTGGFTRNMAATATVVFGTTGGSVTNAPNLTVNAGASALTITASSWFKNLNFTGSTSTVTSTNVNIAGNLTLASGGTYTAVAPTYRATGTLTSNGKTLSALTVNGSGITVTCADALTSTNALTLTLGTLRLKNAVTSTVGSIVTTGTTLKFLESSTAASQATISDSSGTNTVTYLSIKDSSATGGAIFDASDPTNVNAGNNTGWSFVRGGGSFIAFFM